MRRILAALLTGISLLTCVFAGKAAPAQTSQIYRISTVTPASAASGNGDTVLMMSGTYVNRPAQVYNLCFYTGITSASIVPTASNQGSPGTFTFTVPGARFQTAGAAASPTIYLVAGSGSNPTGCNGTNPGISNSYTYSITATSYAFRTASPATLPTGSATTSITFTGSFPTFPSNTTGLGLCFYAGTNNSPLLPTSQPNTSTATFSVPSADFNVAGSAKIYLAPATSTCNGTNPGYGGTLSFAVTQAQNFTITSASPSTLPAGSDDTYIALTGTSNATNTLNDGLCFYTGATATSISPYNISATEADFIVPSTSFLIPPSAFTSGIFNVKAYLAPINSSCTGTNPGISNTFTIPIAYPTLARASLATLSQANPAVTASPVPNKVDLIGANFIARTVGRFVEAGAAQVVNELPGSLASSTSVQVGIPRFTGSFTSTALSACNYSVSNTYEYCSAATSVPLFPLAATTTQITAFPSAPATNQATSIQLKITPSGASTTAGGAYVPGIPTGTVTVSDGGTVLGTATLGVNNDPLTQVSTQQIDVTANGGSASSSNQFNTLIADFNQDGIPDSLIVQPATGVMHLFLGGSPAGTLLPESTITTSADYCSSVPSVAVGDLDGDGYPDIAFLCGGSGSNSYLNILYNAGDGTFPNGTQGGINVFGNQLAIGDLDGDGSPELVVSGLTSYSCCSNVTYGIQVYYTGDGIYPGQRTATADNPGTQVVFKDLNNDGYADLAFLHYNAATGKTEVSVYQSNGNGGFTAQTPIPVSNGTTSTAKLIVTPLTTTASLYPDVAVIFPDTQSVITALNQRTATLAFAAPATQTFSGLKDAVIGNFNASSPNLAFYDGNNVKVAYLDGRGGFDTSTEYTSLVIGTGAANLISLAAAPDLNQDGYSDLVAIFPTATATTSTVASYVTSVFGLAVLDNVVFTTPGTHNLTSTYNGDREVLGSTGSLPLSVGRTAPTITWTPATATNTTTPLGSNILNATASVPGSFAYTPAASSFLAAGTQTITAVFTPTDTNTYSAVTTTRNVTVNKTTPTITTTINPGNHTYTPNLATTYNAFVNGAFIVPTGNVQFNTNGSPTGALASLSQSGTNQSSTNVVFSSLPAGTFAFTGTYQGDAVYNAVTSAVTNYTVSQATPTVTFAPNPATIVQGAALTAAQLNATSNVPGSFAYSPGLGTVLPAGANTITATFTPTDATDYQTVIKTATVTVNPRQNPIILFTPNPSSVPYGTPVSAGQLNATENSNLPGTFTYNYALGAILPVGANIITATFTPTDTANYNTVTKTATITVTQFTPVIAWATPASIPYGTALSATQLNAVANDINGVAIPGTYSYNPAAGTIPSVGSTSDTVTFTPTNTTNFATASATRTITVTQATPTVTFTPNPATLFQGQPLSANQLNATASVPGSFAYNPGLGTVLPTGPNTITAVFTPTNTTNYASVTRTAVVTVTSQLTPVLTYNPTPTSITYGTGLVASQLTAAAVDPNSGSTIPGTFTFTTSAGTVRIGSVLPTGTNTITSTFTPTDGNTYKTAASNATITVTKAAPVVTWNPPASTNTTTPLASSGILNATANVPGTYAYTPSSGYLPAGPQTISLAFTPTDTTNYSSFTSTRNVTVLKTTPLIATSVAGFSPTYDPTARFIYTAVVQGASNIVPTGTVQVTNNGSPFGSPGALSLDGRQPAQAIASIPLTLQAGSYVFLVTYLGDAIYSAVTEPASATRGFTVAQANPTLTFVPNPATITQGQPLTAAQLDATANIPGTFSYNPGLGTILPAGPNTITATFTPTDTTNYNTVSKDAVVTVASKLNPVISFAPNPATIPYGTPLSSAQLNAFETSSIPGAFSYSSPLGTVLPVGANTLVATFTPTDTTTYSTVTKTATVTVTQFTPAITWAASTISYGTALSSAQLNAVASDLNGTAIPGTYTYNPAAGTILPVGANPVTVTFTPTNTTNFAAATATRTITVIRTATVTTLSINPASIAVGQSSTITATVTPTSGAGPVAGQVSFTDSLGTISPAQVTLSNGVATFSYTPTAVGTHVITVSFPNTTNNSASSAGGNLIVGRGAPVINFTPNPATIPYGTPLSAAQLNAVETTGTILGAFSYSSPLGTVLNAGANTITATFTPTDTTSYSTIAKTAVVNVTQFTPVIVWATPASIPFGTPLSSTQLNAVANDLNGVAVPGAYSYNPAAGTVLPLGTTQDTLTFTPTSTTNFATAAATRAITVVAASTTTALNINPGTITLGQSTTLTATVTPTTGTATATGTVTFTDSRGTIPSGTVTVSNGVATLSYTPAANGTHTIIATYSGSTNYSGSSGIGTLAVGQGLPVITFAPNPSTIVYGTPLSAAQLNAVQTTSIPGVFSYSSPLGTILPVGANVITATFTPTDTTSFATVTKTATVAVTQAIPTITWTPPASTLTNIPLDTTILNATASIPGTFAYTPAAGSYLNFGTATLNLLFTPTDNTNYQTASASRTIAVGKANPTPILLTASPASQTAPNLPVVFTVSISGTNITPSGIVRLFESTTLLGSGSVTQAAGHNGTASITVSTLTSGVHSIVANIAADTLYNEATSAPLAYNVGGATVPITFAPNPATIPYGTPLSAAQLNATSTIPGVFTYSPALNAILDAGANTITATFNPTDTATYATTVKTATVTVTQFTPVIAWAAPNAIPYGTPLSATQLNAVARDISGVTVPGTYSYNPAAGTVLPVGTTQDTVSFTPTNTQNFAAAASSVPISVNPGATTTTLGINPGSISLGQSVTLTATVAPVLGTAPITGSVIFTDSRETIPSSTVTIANGVATLTYTPTLNGTHAITASFPGNTTYSPSFAVSTLAVGQGLPVITFAPNPATIPYGTPLSAAQLNAVQTTSIPGVISYSSPLGTVLPVGANTITATFTPTDTATYATATRTATVTVTQFTPVVVWATPAAIPYGTALSATQLNAAANDINGTAIPGTYAYAPPAGTVFPVGTTQESLTFTPTNTTNFATVTATRAITVTAGATATTVGINPGSIALGQSTTLTATVAPVLGTAPVAGSVTFTDNSGAIPSGTVTLSNGVATLAYTPTTNGTHAVTATYSGNTTYAASTGVGTLAVGQGLPVITFAPNPATIPYGTPLSAAQLNAVQTTSIPGVFSYSSPLGTVLNAGTNILTATFTPTDTAAYAIVTKTATITVLQGVPTIAWNPNPSTITFGTPLSAAQLNAAEASGIPGTIAYSSPLATILPVGANTLTATFTPTDAINYTTATGTTVINVTSAASSLSLAVTANNTPVVTVTSGTVVTLTATLATNGTSPVYGQVNFCDTAATTCTGTHIVGSAQLTSAGTATLRLIPAIGGHTYQAAFLGTKTNVASASASSPLVVTGTYPTVTTFTTTGATGNFTLNAVVTGTGSPAASPTGTVSFLDTSNANAPLATATLGSATTSQTFPNQTTASGLTGSVILTGDFNGDGIPDIVTGAYANPSSSDQTQTFSVFLGNGDATFALKSTLASQGVQVVTGDFNHDGIVDLAVFPNSGLTTAADVLLGNGDGTFTRKSQIAVPSSYGNALVADFNHDGILDLAIGSDVSTQTGNTTTYTGTLAFYQGTGDGTFASSRTATTPSSAAGSITADFNGDGIPDILASGFFDTSASVLLGKGDGTFTPKSTLIVPFGAIAATTDLDNDGTADLAVVNFYDTSVSTYLGKGDGTFTLKATIQNPAAYQDQSNAFNIAFADFNQDGNPDFAVTADDGVFIYSGAGDGTFTITARAVPQTTNPFTGEDFSLAVADFNKDGLPDVVTNASNYSGSTLVLALNTFTSTATATATNVSPIGAGAHQVVATYPGNTSFRSSASTPINLAGQTFGTILTWTPAPLTLGTPLGAAQLNAVARDVSGNLLPGTFAYTPGAGTVLSVGRQPLSVIFTPADLVTYTVATLATTVQVNGLSTTTALASSANPAAFAAPVSLVATITPVGGSSTTPLTGSVTFLEGVTQLGTAQVANGTATLPISTLSVGSHLLTAVYSGDTAGNYLTSTSTILTQVINTTTPTVTWTPNPATIVYGTRLTSAQLNAVARDVTGATLPGTFTYTPAAGAILPAGNQTLSVTFTPTDTVRYTASTATAALAVTRATPTIVWNTPASINQGTALSAAQLNATATGIGGAALPGTFTYSPAAGAILAAGAQTLNVTFTPTDAANYLTATASVALTVLNPTTGTVLTSSVNPSQFGQPTVLTATIAIPVRGSAVPSGSVTFFDGPTQIGDPAPITVTSTGATATLTVATLGVGAHQLTAAYANDPNYVPSTSLPLAQTITIAPVTLAWTPTIVTIPYGTPLTSAQLNAVPVSPFVPNVSGLFTYTPAAGTILSAGIQTLTASFTPTDTADFLSAAGSTVITVTQATPTLTWPTPAAIAQGTALSATQLNATATGINNQSLPGTFTYTPAAGTVLQAGTTTLRVLFTPSDTINYTTATSTVPLNVSIPSTTTTVTSSLSPSQSGQSVTFTATVAQNGNSTQPLTGTVTFFDGAATLGTSPLTSGSATFTTTALSVATHTIRATYNGTVDFATSTSSPLAQTVTAAATRLAWTPNPASIVYGTPLSAAQLNAVASSITATTVPGAYTYTPATGTVLSARTQTLSVTFTPTDTVNFTAATATTSITVTKATPTVTFPTPAPVAVGTALSTTQLAATATGITGAALPGVYTYTPAAGTLVVSGPQTLSVTFTPTDTANYNNATATTTLNGTATTLTALSATTSFLGDPAKTLTLTGTGFVSDSVARANGIALATTYVSPTTLNATLPPTTFRTVQTLQVTVNNPTQRQTTSALPFTVSAPAVVIKVNAPTTANPGDQPSITSALAAAYPVDVTGTFNLTFAPISGGVVDPAIQFATGGTTSAFTIAAGQTNNPNLQIQTGTVAGTITVRLTLAAGGADVTPTGLAPLVINVPTIAPTITSVTLTRSGRQLTVRTLGFSNTREVTKATFHFVPSAGQQIQTQDVTVDVGSIFAGWYSQSASTAYGSTFLYTQTFTLDDDASVVGQVTVTLGNSVGASASGSSQ